ncbi:hypothetical protein FOBRF1_006267 [Fusarium oxysporum]
MPIADLYPWAARKKTEEPSSHMTAAANGANTCMKPWMFGLQRLIDLTLYRSGQDRNYIKSMHITVPGTGLGGKLLHPRSRCVTEISKQPWHRILNFSTRTTSIPPERSSPEYDSGILTHVPSLLLIYTETSTGQSFQHTESSI